MILWLYLTFSGSSSRHDDDKVVDALRSTCKVLVLNKASHLVDEGNSKGVVPNENK
jgi:hypothetical protein